MYPSNTSETTETSQIRRDDPSKHPLPSLSSTLPSSIRPSPNPAQRFQAFLSFDHCAPNFSPFPCSVPTYPVFSMPSLLSFPGFPSTSEAAMIPIFYEHKSSSPIRSDFFCNPAAETVNAYDKELLKQSVSKGSIESSMTPKFMRSVSSNQGSTSTSGVEKVVAIPASLFGISATQPPPVVHPVKVDVQAKSEVANLGSSGVVSAPSNSVLNKRNKVGRKTVFTPEEENKLKELVEKHGTQAWSEIAAEMPGKNRKQLREHYMNFMASKRVETAFSIEEDRLIIELADSLKRKWTAIAKHFPGRSPINLKNRYYGKLVLKLKPEKIAERE